MIENKWEKENARTWRTLKHYVENMMRNYAPDTKAVVWMEKSGRVRYSWTRNELGEKTEVNR